MSHGRIRVSVIAAIVSIIFTMPTLGATFHVPGDASTIQLGIDLAGPGDTVEIACGDYYESAIGMKEGVILRSASGDPSCVTLNGQGGTTIWLTGLDYCRIQGFTFKGSGTGALRLSHANPFIESCRFEENTHSDGGAIHMLDSEPTILNCTFLNNHASHAGGAIALGNSSPSLISCSFLGNTANFGGAIDAESGSSLLMENCQVENNAAVHAGGGLFVWQNLGPSSLNVNSSTIMNNQAPWGADGWSDPGCYLAVIGSVIDPDFQNTFDGPGIIFIDSTVSTEQRTWGEVKALYR